jgi:hypothetical protein
MFLNDLYRGFGTNLPITGSLPIGGNVWGCYPFASQNCYPFVGQQVPYAFSPWAQAQHLSMQLNPTQWNQQLPYGIGVPFLGNNVIGNTPFTNPILAQSPFYGYTPFNAFNTLGQVSPSVLNPSVFQTTCR